MDNSGPAFPESCNGQIIPGMTLRDYFAGQALAGLTNVAFTYFTEAADDNKDGARKFSAEIGQTAYMVADAMLDERSKT